MSSASDFTAVSGPGSLEVPAATIPLVGVDAHAGENLFHMMMENAPDGGIVWIDGQCSILNPLVGDCDEATAELLPTSTDPFTAYTPLSTTPQNFVNAVPDTGMGTYYLNPQFRLFVPAETYAGVYRSNIIITLIATAP